MTRRRVVIALVVVACALGGAWLAWSLVLRVLANMPDLDGRSPLHEAVGEEDVDRVRSLLAHGADANRGYRKGNGPIYISAHGPLDIVQLLVEHGADASGTVSHNTSVLQRAASSPHADRLSVVQYLLAQGADVNAADEDGMTPLHEAARAGCLDVVRYLVEEQGVDAKTGSGLGRTAMSYAAGGGGGNHLDTLRYLVEEQGLDAKAEDSRGNTALHSAVYNLNVVRYLVEEQGVDVDATNHEGLTPLHKAAWRNALDTVRYLVKERSADVNAADSHGCTPLHLAVQWIHADHRRSILDVKPEMPRCLVELGANVNAADSEGNTPLQRSDQEEIREVLRELGATGLP